MREAIDLALRGRGEVEPNPRVGALAIERDEIVGRAWHAHWGGPHAEVEALAAAQRSGRRPDTIVVTLEPCASEGGEKKTPPCTRALAACGITRLIAGAVDPDPRQGGRGLRELAAAGIDVQDGVLASECRAINRPFERWLALDRPWTIGKWAMTLDGKTAAPTGEARWISGFEARRKVHELRARVDAVVVGYRTAQLDDPELTVRHVAGPQPLRVVVDPQLALDDSSRLLSTARQLRTLVLASEHAHPSRVARVRELGADVLLVRPAERGRRLQLLDAWRELRRRGVRRLMVEGGGGLLAQLIGWGCLDQVWCFVAPKIIGGQLAPTAVAGPGKPFMAEAWRFDEMTADRCGEDWLLRAVAV
jgi:diaminohydroxyphosphoribosylaminopyrimidine deaminase/5-amino-6-(5-phosphoribosylamino)uracil reductase